MQNLWRESRGFLIGLLVIAIPAGAVLLLRSFSGDRIEPPASVPETEVSARIAPPTTSQPADRIDRTGLREAGAALPGPTPLPDLRDVERALARAEGWLRAHEVDPFGGTGVDSLRLFALEVQCWDRLWWAERDPVRRASLGDEVQRRLRPFLDPEQILSRLRAAEGGVGSLEILVLATLCGDHGIEIDPIIPILVQTVDGLTSNFDRIPPSMRLFVAVLIDRLALPGIPPSGRPAGVISYGPYRVVTMGIPEMYALTQQIFAETDLARRFHDPIEPESLQNLREALPHLALSNALLRNRELFADLLSCLALVDLTDTYGYREGMRILLERQADDGGFGDPSGRRAVRLAPTTGALTSLSLERVRAGRGS